ncbi:hypothetical protein D3C78_1649640 [compost metagenome]
MKLNSSLWKLLTVMPGVRLSTSGRLVRFWSSICWRPITVIDCGVSRRDNGNLVAVLVARVV